MLISLPKVKLYSKFHKNIPTIYQIKVKCLKEQEASNLFIRRAKLCQLYIDYLSLFSVELFKI